MIFSKIAGTRSTSSSVDDDEKVIRELYDRVDFDNTYSVKIIIIRTYLHNLLTRVSPSISRTRASLSAFSSMATKMKVLRASFWVYVLANIM